MVDARKGKTWEEIYGKERAGERRESMKYDDSGFKSGKDNWSYINGAWNKGKKMSESTRRKMSESRKGMKVCVNFSDKRPNYMEEKLLSWIEEVCPGDFKYTGNFSVWIGGRNPDFINVNGKKLIIEFFGDHWHKPEDEDIKRNIYSEYGFKTLFIWGHEMKDKDSVMKRIDEFIGG